MPTINIDETDAGRLTVEFTCVDDGTGALGGSNAGVPLQSSDMSTFTIKYAYNGSSSSAYAPTVTQIDATNLKGGFVLNIPSAMVASANGFKNGDHFLVFITNNGGTQKMVRREMRIDLVSATAAVAGAGATAGSGLSAIPTSFVLTTGSQVNTYANTAGYDQSYHQISDAAGTLDCYYVFDISTLFSGSVAGAGLLFQGYLAGAANSLKVYAYNWSTTSWDQVGVITGQGSTTEITTAYALTNQHTGSGVVRMRFSGTGLTSATLYVDRALLSYVVLVNTTSIAGAVLDATTAAHSSAGTIGAAIGSIVVRTGVTQGVGSNTVILDASYTGNPVGQLVTLRLTNDGPGYNTGETRQVISFDVPSLTATVNAAWLGTWSPTGTYAYNLTPGALTDLSGIPAAVWNLAAVGSRTFGDLQRLNMAMVAGPVVDFTTNTLVFRCPVLNTIRATVTRDNTGRTNVSLGTLSP